MVPQGMDIGTARSGTLSRATKLFYGLGEAGEGVKTAALEIFLFFYYVQVVGLSGTLTGIALFIALLVDGITDPWVGGWSDRTRTRFGRRHPFLYAAPVPLAAALLGLFMPPTMWSQIGLFVWLTGFAIAARVAMTLYFIPHMALGAELSHDFHERVSIGGYRVFFGYIGRIIALGLAFSVFFVASNAYPNGQLNPAAYPIFALTCGGLVILFVITSALGTQRLAMRLPDVPAAEGLARQPSFAGTITNAAISPSFRALFIALLIMYTYNGVQGALALHMNTYYWLLTPQQIQFVFYATLFGYLIGIPIVRPLASRIDKKAAYMWGIAGSCISGSTPTILSLSGLFPSADNPATFPLLILSGFLVGSIGTIPVVLAAAMLADVADEYEDRHEGRSEGLFFGANAFCRKASLGLGGAAAGMVIDLIRFPVKAEPGTVPDEALIRLAITYGPVMLLVLLAGLAMMIPYDLSRTRHAEIMERIGARRAGQ